MVYSVGCYFIGNALAVFKTFPLITPGSCLKSLSSSLQTPLMKCAPKSPWNLLFSRLNIPQLSQPVCIAEMLQPSELLHGLLWTCFNRLSFLC